MDLRQTLSQMYQGRTLVFGHRGAKAYAPMNTIPAFELAAEQGADGVELDVHRSKDGYAVVVHDFTVDHTTNGRGRVTDMTLAELKALDAGSWFGKAFIGVQIPTLDEVFAAIGNKLFVNVEIKAEGPNSDGVEQVVADCIKRHGMESRVIVSSFNPPTLKLLRAIIPEVAIGFLYEPTHVYLTKPMMTDFAYEAVHPYHEMIDEAVIEEAREQGHIINTWTVNVPERAIQLHNLGVDGIVTDNPDTIIKALTS